MQTQHNTNLRQHHTGTHGAFVPLDKSWEVSEAIMTTFRDYGYRYNPRTKCRLMYLIDDMGIDGFRAEVCGMYVCGTCGTRRRSPQWIVLYLILMLRACSYRASASASSAADVPHVFACVQVERRYKATTGDAIASEGKSSVPTEVNSRVRAS